MQPTLESHDADRQLPFGTEDLDPNVQVIDTQSKTVRCYVCGCDQVLRAPRRRGQRGDFCPVHGIRCHYSQASATYSYRDVRRNIITSADLFARRIVGHPFKYESHRLGSENSEDALSWNVFRSLQEGGQLPRVAAMITGEFLSYEPFLYLWGICTTGDELDPWDLLIQARDRFENNLPVERPKTEPDIALHLPGRYLILIEAKFTSPNTSYKPGPRRDEQSLTFDELLEIYHDDALAILNRQRASEVPRIYYQLWRNTVFAEWMSREDHPRTKAYHVNLVRSGDEHESAREFAGLVNDGYKDRFLRLTWEEIYARTRDGRRLTWMHRYLRTKTAGLRKAFQCKS
jgi:hypothetical protein